MLCSLSIKNIALIDELNISFDKGLNILSGETGAGKSIIVDSLSLILGERADRELIKSGEESALVEAFFDGPGVDPDVADEFGVDLSEGLVVSRELQSNGKSSVRINGRLSTAGVLKEIAGALVDLHGQHEHQALLNEKNHICFLDGYGGEAIALAKEEASRRYAQFREAERQLSELKKKCGERERRLDMLTFQINEIEGANYKEGEYDELVAKRDVLANAERVTEALAGGYYAVYDADGRAIMTSLKSVITSIEDISALDERYGALLEKLSDAYYTLEDCAYELRDLKDELYFDEGKLNSIEDRLFELNSLMRKYGGDMDSVMRYYGEISEELALLSDSEYAAARLEKERDGAKAALEAACAALCKARKEAARAFEAGVMRELADLGLGGSKFKVLIEKKDYSPDGYDNVEFFISTNPGEPLKPLKKVVSGGEVSRIMLAFKVISAGSDTMVFDEIDTGISGKMAQVVAGKLGRIASAKQVICVTHLPQIAAMADRHFLITKTSGKDFTKSSVAAIEGEERVEEIARLAGGDTQAARAHAREIIERSSNFKLGAKA